MKQIIHFLLVCLLMISQRVFAQKDVQVTMHGYAESVINPALTSADRGWDATLLARDQWFDFNRAPATQFLSFEMPLGLNNGLGLAVMHDQLGYENNFDISMNYARFFKVGDQRRIGFGLAGNLLSKNIDGTQLIYDEMNDPNGIYTSVTQYNINLNAGLSYVSPHLTLGFSTRHLAATGLDETEIFLPARHYYLYGSYLLNVNEHLALTPSVLMKTNFQLHEYNISAVAEFEQTLRFGVNYRLKESTALMLGLVFLKHFQVMYAYDIITGSVQTVSPASHEIVLRYLFKPKPPKAPYLKSPRYLN